MGQIHCYCVRSKLKILFLYRIENLEQSNEGVYICRASSAYGQAQDTARLTIQGLSPVLQMHSYLPDLISQI